MTLVSKAGPNGEQEKDALESSIVTIGWNEIPDVSKIDSKQALKDLYLKFNPNTKGRSLAIMAGEIWDFAKKNKERRFSSASPTSITKRYSHRLP